MKKVDGAFAHCRKSSLINFSGFGDDFVCLLVNYFVSFKFMFFPAPLEELSCDVWAALC